jgi:hypothetical protein
VIKFVICGIEHSGTTLISDLFRQIDGVDAGFEVGVLLSASPRAFRTLQPFAENMLKGWQLHPKELDHCCDTDDLEVFYGRLLKASKAVKPGTTTTFDKTPRYLIGLDACMQKVNVPFIVSYKDPRAIVHSDFVRAKAESFDAWFGQYAPTKLRYMNGLYNQYKSALGRSDSRACLVALENLCLDARRACDLMFSHAGFEFRTKYLVLENLRYEHNRSTSISVSIPFEYKKAFSSDVQRRIRDTFASCADWFYD